MLPPLPRPRACLLTALTLLTAFAELQAAPLTTKYDQRQDGDFNVHAHLENFVILLIPSGSGGLFSLRAHNPSKRPGAAGASSGGPGTAGKAPGSALLAKGPPYKVDIDAESHRPRAPPIVLEIAAAAEPGLEPEIVIAESPAVVLRAPAQAPPKEKDKPVPSPSPSPSPAPSPAPTRPSTPSPAPTRPSTPSPAPSAPSSPRPPAHKPVSRPPPVRAPSTSPAPPRTSSARPTSAPSSAAPQPAEAPAKEETGDAAEEAAPAQEARARAARLEQLRRGLEPSPSARCAPHETRDRHGRCLQSAVHAPARVSKSFPSQELLAALRRGLEPAL